MSEPKFTPGPWSFSRGQGRHFQHVVITAPSMPAHSPLAHIPDWDEPEASADAALIAAAPDLYAALEAAIECGMVPNSSSSDGGASRHARQVHVADMIRAALAKARGET